MATRILFTFMITFLFAGYATATTPVPEAEKEIQFIEEVNLDREKVFDSTVDWFAESFVDSKDVLELKDKERMKIIGKGVIPECFSMGSPSTGWGAYFKCRVTIIVEIKEGRIRTTFKDITALGKDGASYPILDKSYNDQARTKINNLQNEYITYLSKKKNEKDW